VRDGRISAVGAAGAVRGTGTTEIDAEGKLVTPGWVDVHSVRCADLPLPASCPWLPLTQATLAQHYDGQATWDPYITPTSYHGVTTTIFGNCGVGFAPIKPGQEPWLINLMEGVEDIPGSVTDMHLSRSQSFARNIDECLWRRSSRKAFFGASPARPPLERGRRVCMCLTVFHCVSLRLTVSHCVSHSVSLTVACHQIS
jgi:hypothetical protein